MNPVLRPRWAPGIARGSAITEETDAIAVIVSEESGAISLACRGKFRARYDGGAIARALERAVAPLCAAGDVADADVTATEEAARPGAGSRIASRTELHAGGSERSLWTFLRRYVFAHFGYKVVRWHWQWDCGGRSRRTRWPSRHHRADRVSQYSKQSGNQLAEYSGSAGAGTRAGAVDSRLASAGSTCGGGSRGCKPGERTFDLTAQQVRLPHELEVTAGGAEPGATEF